eukprot:3071756-Lingulodinium_polyedra.AAC.1
MVPRRHATPNVARRPGGRRQSQGRRLQPVRPRSRMGHCCLDVVCDSRGVQAPVARGLFGRVEWG